ncbi:MAG: hypothetical protein ACPHJ3_12275 [Rubripirellula sp.]
MKHLRTFRAGKLFINDAHAMPSNEHHCGKVLAAAMLTQLYRRLVLIAVNAVSLVSKESAMFRRVSF